MGFASKIYKIPPHHTPLARWPKPFNNRSLNHHHCISRCGQNLVALREGHGGGIILHLKQGKMMATQPAEEKIKEIRTALKAAGLWKKQVPPWVTDYEKKIIANENDFAEWLQFIYLPNCTAVAVTEVKKYIVPQAVRFFGEDVKKGKLLQLLIELDALL
jgi:uncharacterized protein YqcC (DUF446 family)